MLKIFAAKQDEDITDTGTFADGLFEFKAAEPSSLPRRQRGHLAHSRDYSADRFVSERVIGFV